MKSNAAYDKIIIANSNNVASLKWKTRRFAFLFTAVARDFGRTKISVRADSWYVTFDEVFVFYRNLCVLLNIGGQVYNFSI
jgi:hypothetical protein